MSAPSYQLNPMEAKEGSGGGRNRIQSNGAFEGSFTKAKYIVAQTGASGIEFEFESVASEHARFTLYTHNKDHQPIYGAKQLQAIMAVLKQRQISAKVAMIEEYDFDAGQKQTVQAEIYPELMNRKIGVVFQMEEYISGNGDIKSRPNFFAPFDTGTRQLAVEILEQAPASRLDKLLPTLKTKTVPVKSTAPSSYASQPSTAFKPDDDIPF